MPGRSLVVAAMASLLISAGSISRGENLNYSTTWIGNTFPGTPNDKHIQNGVNGAFIASDGTIICDSGWDENGEECGVYKNNDVSGRCDGLHGWGRGGGKAVVADANYIYIAMSQNGDDGANTNLNSNGLRQYPDKGNIWYCVRRYSRSTLQPALFSSGYGIDGSMLIVTSVAKDANGHYADLSVAGLTISGSKLCVGDPANGKIHTYNTSDLSSAGDWTCARCGELASDSAGNVWAIQTGDASNAPKVVKFNSGGVLQSAQVTFASGVKPYAIAVNSSTGYLLVTDTGPNQNVKIYNPASLSGSPTATSSTLGAAGGIFAGTSATIGTAGPLRFNQPVGVGVDSSGNTYVVSTGSSSLGGTVIESYSASLTRNWALYGLEFVDTAEADANSDTDVFSKEEHFVFDYTKTTPGSEWSYKAFTFNPIKYPNDPRQHNTNGVCSPWVRTIGGKRFLFSTDMMTSIMLIHRFNSATDGEVAIPSGMIAKGPFSVNGVTWPTSQPTAGEWIWRDTNGDGDQQSSEFAGTGANAPISGWGWWVDSNGDVWQCSSKGVRHYICQGLDSTGNPIYDFATGHTVTISPPTLESGVTWNDILRVRYFPVATDGIPADTMFLSGYTNAWPDNTGGWWGLVGRVIYRFDNWSGTRTIHAGYPIVLPSDTTVSPETPIVSMDIAGDYVFAGRSRNPQTITIYNVNTGVQLGTLTPGLEVGGPGSTGWLDFRDTLRARKRSTGEYLLFVEEDWKAKVLLYRWWPKYETELLQVASSSGDTHRIIADPNFSNGNATILDSNAVGDYVTYTLPHVKAGTYDVRIGTKKFNTRGIVQLNAAPAGGSGSNVGAPQDLYVADQQFTEYDLGNWSPGSTSDKWFKFSITGKNASSSGYSECFDYIKLIPQ